MEVSRPRNVADLSSILKGLWSRARGRSAARRAGATREILEAELFDLIRLEFAALTIPELRDLLEEIRAAAIAGGEGPDQDSPSQPGPRDLVHGLAVEDALRAPMALGQQQRDPNCTCGTRFGRYEPLCDACRSRINATLGACEQAMISGYALPATIDCRPQAEIRRSRADCPEPGFFLPTEFGRPPFPGARE